MREIPVLISVNMDKEEVGLTFENYNLVSAGVVNKDNKLIGDISGNTTIIGDFDMSGNFDLSGNMDISGTLDVSQNIIGRKTITAEGGFVGDLTGAASTKFNTPPDNTTVGKIGEIKSLLDNEVYKIMEKVRTT